MGGGTVEFFWLHQTILPPTPILLHGPLKKPSHSLLFYLSNCYWQKTSTFARVFFFSMISCEKTKKTLQRARNNALLLFLHQHHHLESLPLPSKCWKKTKMKMLKKLPWWNPIQRDFSLDPHPRNLKLRLNHSTNLKSARLRDFLTPKFPNCLSLLILSIHATFDYCNIYSFIGVKIRILMCPW